MFRVAFDQADKFDFVHLNDLAAPESVAYLIKFDSVHGERGIWNSPLQAWTHGLLDPHSCKDASVHLPACTGAMGAAMNPHTTRA